MASSGTSRTRPSRRRTAFAPPRVWQKRQATRRTSRRTSPPGRSRETPCCPNLRAPDGSLVQSTEALAAGTGWLDAAVMEAIDMGLVDPSKQTATATLADIENGLVPASGRGFMRSDAGDSYSSNEWVFIDFRAARALDLQSNTSVQHELVRLERRSGE